MFNYVLGKKKKFITKDSNKAYCGGGGWGDGYGADFV